MRTVIARRRCNELKRMLYPHSRRRVLVFLVVACSHARERGCERQDVIPGLRIGVVDLAVLLAWCSSRRVFHCACRRQTASSPRTAMPASPPQHATGRAPPMRLGLLSGCVSLLALALLPALGVRAFQCATGINDTLVSYTCSVSDVHMRPASLGSMQLLLMLVIYIYIHISQGTDYACAQAQGTCSYGTTIYSTVYCEMYDGNSATLVLSTCAALVSARIRASCGCRHTQADEEPQ